MRLNLPAVWSLAAFCAAAAACAAPALPRDRIPKGLPFEVRWNIEGLYSPDPRLRCACARALGGMGERAAAAAPFLTAMLGDRTEAVTHFPEATMAVRRMPAPPSPDRAAAAALARIGTPAGGPLLRLLARPAAAGRALAVQALSNIRDPRALPAIRAAATDADAAVRLVAITALAHRTGAEGAMAAVAAALRDTDVRVRLAAVTPLCRAHPAAPVVSVLVAALRDKEVRIRRKAAGALVFCKSRQVAEGMAAALDDPDENVRAFAARALGYQADRAFIEPLMGALKDKSVYVRAMAAPALAILARNIGDRRPVPALIALFGDSDSSARHAAAEAFRHLQDPRAVEPLIRALRDEDHSVRSSAAWALGGFKNPRAAEPLLALAQKSDERTLPATAWALGQIKEKRAVEPLMKALRAHKRFHGRWYVVRALGDIGDPRAVPVLVEILKTGGEHDRAQAAYCLALLNAHQAADALFKASSDSSRKVRTSAIRSLVRLKDPRIIPCLIAFLEKPGDLGRPEAARSLGLLTGQDFGEDTAKWAAWWEANRAARGRRRRP